MAEFRTSSATNTPSINIKTTGADVVSMNIVNRLAGVIYVRFYNSPVATFQDTPFRTFQVASSSNYTITPNVLPRPIFSTTSGLCVRVTTGATDTDNTAPGTLPLIEIQYN